MKRVLTAVILVPIVVVALFRAPLWLFALLVLGVALLAAREYFDIAEKTGYRPMRGWGYVGTSYIFLLSFWVSLSFELMPLLILSMPVALIAALAMMAAHLRRGTPTTALADVGVSILSLAYVAVPLSVLVIIRSIPRPLVKILSSEPAPLSVLGTVRSTYGLGSLFLLFLMLIVWAGDITALYVGRSLGTHKLAPRVSPGKTWEGALGSLAGSVIIGILLFHFAAAIETALVQIHLLTGYHESLPILIQGGTSLLASKDLLWFSVLFALSINLAAQLGDLVESWFKRGAGVKDSGTLVPGHGGVLDRIDALLFALPVGLIFYGLMMWWAGTGSYSVKAM